MSIILIAHNIRSSHNVGSLLRTADGLGVEMVYLTGYTPYPRQANDTRLPHIAAKVEQQIAKTALGAESSVDWKYVEDVEPLLEALKKADYTICALEQTPSAKLLPSFRAPDKIALIVGREVEGIEPEILKLCDQHVQIPMLGSKESFNVGVAAAIALYALRYNH